MADKVRVGIVGATGYVGMELVRLLSGHRRFVMTQLVSESYAGKAYAAVHPSFAHVSSHILQPLDPGALAGACDLVITALPHGISAAVVPDLLDRGLRVIDHSGDFRYKDAAVYEKAYQLQHPRPDLLAVAVYGLPELYRDAIARARLVANPGCYPTCSLLAVQPLLRSGLVRTGSIIIDAVSGVSGAGRKADLAFSFCETDASFKAYSVVGHRHTSEIEQECGYMAGLDEPLPVTFTPHLAPFKRGMLATVYADLHDGVSESSIRTSFESFYGGARFVRLLPAGQSPETRMVAGTNFADLAVFIDSRTGRVKVLSAIDNLGKGAASQAVQALNIMAGFAEDEGLCSPGWAV